MTFACFTSRCVLAVVCAAGCGTSIGVTPLNPSPRPLVARSAAEVEVFLDATPPRPYVDVAVIEAEQSSELSSDEAPQFIAKMRAEAASMGCDGLRINGATSRDTVSWSDITHDAIDLVSKQPVPTPETYGEPVTLHGMVATCIVYRDPEIPVAAPADAVASSDAKAKYDACRQQRIEIMRRAAQIKDLPGRGRMFRTMPSCGDRPS